LGSRKVRFTPEKGGSPATAEISNPDGSVTRLLLEMPWTPTAADLASLTGDWYSEEAGATFTVAVEGDRVFLKQRPASKFSMRPIYKDAFSVEGGYVAWFTRDSSGKIDKMHLGASRMRDMPFVRSR